MRRGWIKLECDLCGEPDSYPADKPWSTAEDGWTQDENHDGRILDLCPRCTRDVAPIGTIEVSCYGCGGTIQQDRNGDWIDADDAYMCSAFHDQERHSPAVSTSGAPTPTGGNSVDK